MRSLLVASVLVVATHAHAGPACPVRLKTARAQPLVFAKSIDAARTLLMKGTVGPHDDVMAPAATMTAFRVEVRRSVRHGSASSNWEGAAVFLVPTGVVIASRLATFTSVIPEKCSEPLEDAVLEARVETIGGRSFGVVRVRRASVKDAAGLAAVAVRSSDPECTATTTYRIEDHVFDLDKRRELVVVGGAYTGPVYEEHAPPLPPLAALTLTAHDIGVDDTQCKAVAWRP